jgi:uncharacterized protein YndB with AHSA1/START domain
MTMKLNEAPVATAGMLIRRAPIDVYEAFVDSAITTKFWFSDGSDRLDAGRPVIWTWAMYGVSTRVEVKELLPGKKILIEWDTGTEEVSTVEWIFSDRGGNTFVEVLNFNLKGDADAQVLRAIDSAGGFALVLAGAKAWLEQGIELNVVRDRHPDMLVEGWKD